MAEVKTSDRRTENVDDVLAIKAVDVRIRRGTAWGGRDGREIVHGVSFEVERGTVTGLLGPSGCGKTTLMRAIVGIQRGVSGDLRVLGRGPCERELHRRVGYATQTASVYSDLTVTENLRYFTALSAQQGALSPQEVIRGAERAAARVSLSAEMHTQVGRLSGGQRGRVSLAAAIIGGRELLVLDEPTVGLDPVLRRELWDGFHQLADQGLTLLISSHVMDEASRCDRLLLLREGRLIADETPESLLEITGAADLDHAFLCLVEPRRAPRQTPPPPAERAQDLSRATTDCADPPETADPLKTANPPETAGSPGTSRSAAAPQQCDDRGLRLNLPRTTVTALRVLRQMRRDPRTILLVLVLPPALLVLLQAIFAQSPTAFDRAGAGLLGVFPLMTMFFLTSVAMLRERRSGTLERLMTTPIGRGDLLTGYGVAFGLLAVAQAAITTTTAVALLHLAIAGPLVMLGLLAVLSALFGTALGLLTSAFANSEFQAVQFLPPVLLPQFLLCGILVPHDQLHPVLGVVSMLMPMTYVVDALSRISTRPGVSMMVVRDALVIAGCAVVALALAAGTLRRQTP
ncbi:ABC-2 type transport system permease protein [Parafrankia irregularis]|uniref:Transport permease protein n=1 Tax=Parafrankia irregularis TaxID=795642 RepID=A0A0S4QRV0_9ACTN|nr:ABC transporter ATP-binding protein/permease [Parafrankia sp. CH37]MBE3201874.1 ABC transporter ATP-binding protein/permease [Parafrankia sp. CH37]CUU58359.1 ABC-2 type transport system permease protein [Parafrankia irregularis]